MVNVLGSMPQWQLGHPTLIGEFDLFHTQQFPLHQPYHGSRQCCAARLLHHIALFRRPANTQARSARILALVCPRPRLAIALTCMLPYLQPCNGQFESILDQATCRRRNLQVSVAKTTICLFLCMSCRCHLQANQDCCKVTAVAGNLLPKPLRKVCNREEPDPHT